MSLLQKSILRNLLPTAFLIFSGPGSRWLTGGLLFLRGFLFLFWIFNFFFFFIIPFFYFLPFLTWFIFISTIFVGHFCYSFIFHWPFSFFPSCLQTSPHCSFHANNCFFSYGQIIDLIPLWVNLEGQHERDDDDDAGTSSDGPSAKIIVSRCECFCYIKNHWPYGIARSVGSLFDRCDF